MKTRDVESYQLFYLLCAKCDYSEEFDITNINEAIADLREALDEAVEIRDVIKEKL